MFATTEAGKIIFRSQVAADSKTWSIWHDFSSPFAGKMGSITAAVNTSGRIVVLGVDASGQVWQATQTTAGDTTNWSAFTMIGSFGVLGISAARNADGRVDLMGVDAGGNVWRRAQTSAGATTWTLWAGLPQKTLADIGAQLDANGRVLVVGVDNLGNIWQTRQSAQNATSYGGWTQIDGQLRP